MTPALRLYRALTVLLSPFAGMWLRRRALRGKEDPRRIGERFGRTRAVRPPGPLVWLHGASVGEGLMLRSLALGVAAAKPETAVLITTQTQTAASLLAPAPAGVGAWIQQMAPIDTPGAVRRFVRHWSPDLAVFGEGEIWPNLIFETGRAGAKTALVNARMSARALAGWRRRPGSARALFGRFDLILAADERTGDGLSALLGRPVSALGNVKASAPPLDAPPGALEAFQTVLADRPVFLAASTHPGEEALALEARAILRDRFPDLFTIIAPRHPERAEEIAALAAGCKTRFRSQTPRPSADTDVFIADTIGEMGIWYRLANAVYLGGGHAPGVGGHNPIEPARLGKTALSGPSVANFEPVFERLAAAGAARFVDDAPALAAAVNDILERGDGSWDQAEIERRLAEAGGGAYERTVATLLELLA